MRLNLNYALAFVLLYLLGLLSVFFINLDATDKLLSPFYIIHDSKELLPSLVHSSLYFFSFATISFFLANSRFGYCFIPILPFAKGVFTCVSVAYLFETSQSIFLILIYALIITIEFSLLILYFVYCVDVSLSFKRITNRFSFNNDAYIYICLSVLMIIVSIIQVYL